MARGGRNTNTPGRSSRALDKQPNNDKIKVVVRVRPFNGRESSVESRSVVRVVGEQMLVFDPKEDKEPEYFHGKARRRRDISKKAARDIMFMFDHVFGSESLTFDLFENTTKQILDGLMDGYNCSIFAYGATGAGKTHTMLGSTGQPGVIFLTMMDLYRRMDEVKDVTTCDIAVSYLEVYNEQIRDLLMPGGFLPVREDPARGVIVIGLSLHKPFSADELLHMLRIGNSNRTQHPTDANAESSRSHAVFQVFVRQRDRTANTSADWRVAKMSLIDLAGSERATATKNCGARFREGANINRSLLALGNCINALAEGKSHGYVPYRNSKLTRLIKDSLGGNCRTVMIAAISPASLSFEDTYNTLRYADRAKNINVGLKRNIVSVDLHVSRYVQVIEDLRREVNELKIKLHTAESGVIASGTYSPDIATKATYERLRTSLESVFKARISTRKEMLELEASYRRIQYRAYRKQQILARIGLVIPGEKDTTKCLTRAIENAEKRCKNIDARRASLQSRMVDNAAWLNQVEAEVKKSMPDNPMTELLTQLLMQDIETFHQDVEIQDLRRQARYLKRLCRSQEREAATNDRFTTLLLQTVHNQFMVLKGHNIASHVELQQFAAVQQMVCQNVDRNVAWADQSFGPGNQSPCTPGPDSTAGSTDFSLSTLLDFPILTASLETPSRTPHCKVAFNSETKTTPRNNIHSPHTPSSVRRRKRTPFKQPVPNLVLFDDHRDERPTGGTVVCPLQVSPEGSNSAVSRLDFNQVTETQPDVTLPESPIPTELQSVPPSSAQPVSRLPTKQKMQPKRDSANNTNVLCVDSQKRLVNTAIAHCPQSLQKRQIDKSIMLGPQASQERFVDNTIVLGPTIKLPLQNADVHLQGELDKTVVIDSNASGCMSKGLPLPVAPSPAPEHRGDCVRAIIENLPRTPNLSADSVLVNSATVTKSNPNLAKQWDTVTKPRRILNANTVTKHVHSSATVTKSVRVNDENAQVTPRNRAVVRCMDFGGSSCSSPSASGLMTFVEALKSPILSRVMQNMQKVQPLRSPLASRDNLPTSKLPGHHGPGRIPMTTEKLFHGTKDWKQTLQSGPLPNPANCRRTTGGQSRRVTEATATLKRFGVPSMYDHKADASPKAASSNASGTRSWIKPVPSYMQGTKASTRRNKSHRRSITASAQPTGGARRVLLGQKENAPPTARRTLLQSRSKSSANLPMRKGFL